MLKNSACLSATVLPPHPASLWLKDFYINSFRNHKKRALSYHIEGCSICMFLRMWLLQPLAHCLCQCPHNGLQIWAMTEEVTTMKKNSARSSLSVCSGCWCCGAWGSHFCFPQTLGFPNDTARDDGNYFPWPAVFRPGWILVSRSCTELLVAPQEHSEKHTAMVGQSLGMGLS